MVRGASLCAVIPLVILGVGIIALWLCDAWVWLLPLGVATFLGSLACGLLAGVWLCIYRYQVWRAMRRPLWHASRREWIILLLLLANFPITIGGMAWGARMYDRFTVLVVNDSDRPIEHFRLKDVGSGVDYGTIPPHSRHQCLMISPDGDSDVVFHASGAGAPLSGTVYDASRGGIMGPGGPGINARVVVDNDGTKIERE